MEIPAAVHIPEAVIADVARCWSAARAMGRPVQPELYAMLGPAGYEMLVPAFDSLLQLCESLFDPETCEGCPLATEDGESLLCRLIEDPALLGRIGPCRASEGISRVLSCALRSVSFLAGMSAGQYKTEQAKAAL